MPRMGYQRRFAVRWAYEQRARRAAADGDPKAALYRTLANLPVNRFADTPTNRISLKTEREVPEPFLEQYDQEYARRVINAAHRNGHAAPDWARAVLPDYCPPAGRNIVKRRPVVLQLDPAQVDAIAARVGILNVQEFVDAAIAAALGKG